MFRIFGKTVVCSMIAVSVLSGCITTQKQQTYFAAVDVDDENPEVKYYRVTTQARASNKKMEFVAGFHDAQAVRQLYGKVRGEGMQPSNAPRTVVYNANTGMYEVANDQVFTVIFGNDATAMQEQIKAFAKSDKLGKYLGGFLASSIGGEAYANAAALNHATDASRSRVSSSVKQQADTIPDPGTAPQAQAAAEKALRAVALELARMNGVAESLVPSGVDELNAFSQSMAAAYLAKR